jgi:hypothetical protein
MTFGVTKVGGSLTLSEDTIFQQYNFERYRFVGPFRRRSLYKEVQRKYPDITSRLEDLVVAAEGAELKPLTISEIRSGDICINAVYGIQIPENGIFDEYFREEINKNLEEQNLLKRLIGYTHSVNEVLPNFLKMYEERYRSILSDARAHLFARKFAGLEDVLSQSLPGVCFEQAVALNCLISNDPDLRRLGVEYRVVGGKVIFKSKSRWFQRIGYEVFNHAWVKITFQKECSESWITSDAYILDPDTDAVYEYDKKDVFSVLRYIEFPLEESAQFLLRLPKKEFKNL